MSPNIFRTLEMLLTASLSLLWDTGEPENDHCLDVDAGEEVWKACSRVPLCDGLGACFIVQAPTCHLSTAHQPA